jgi:hypothetical protein
VNTYVSGGELTSEEAESCNYKITNPCGTVEILHNHRTNLHSFRHFHPSLDVYESNRKVEKMHGIVVRLVI